MKIVIGIVITALASALCVAAPIAVTGSGQYTWQYMSGPSGMLSLSGSNGTDSVSVSYGWGSDDRVTFWNGLPQAFVNPSPYYFGGRADIDGVQGRGGCQWGIGSSFNLFIGNGAGHVSVLAPWSCAVLASEDLIGWIEYGDVKKYYNPDGVTLIGVTASFVIVSSLETDQAAQSAIAPEPGTAVVGLMFAAMAIAARRRRVKR